MKRLSFRIIWDRLSMYLPILLMGLFAMATFWLIRSAPTALEPAPSRPVRHEADYFLRNFSIRAFGIDGRIRNEVFGAEARHFPDNDTLEIDTVRIRAVGENGLPTVATAQRALSDATGNDVQLFGNVQVRRDQGPGQSGQPKAPVEYRSEYLHVQSDRGKAMTNQPVLISQGQDQFTANAMNYDDNTSVIELTGRVRGVLTPRKAP